MAYPYAPYRFETIEQVLALPALSYRDKRGLPDEPGVYFVLNAADEVIYVGCTFDSIRRRWRVHLETREARRSGTIRIAYVVCRESTLSHVTEAFAIYMLKPSLNVVHKAKWKPYFDKE